jgi:hypothetical protein
MSCSGCFEDHECRKDEEPAANCDSEATVEIPTVSNRTGEDTTKVPGLVKRTDDESPVNHSPDDEAPALGILDPITPCTSCIYLFNNCMRENGCLESNGHPSREACCYQYVCPIRQGGVSHLMLSSIAEVANLRQANMPRMFLEGLRQVRGRLCFLIPRALLSEHRGLSLYTA